jgi:predicted ester cyclase
MEVRTMAVSKVRAVFEKGTDAFNQHDLKGLAATMADDVTTRAPGIGELEGKEAVTAFYKSWMDAFPDSRVEITATHVLTDAVIEEGVFTGTHRGTLSGPGGDLPPTGRSVRVEYIQVLKFRGEKVSSFHLSFDRLTMLEQLGVVPSAKAEAQRAGEGAGQPMQPH